MLPSLVEVTWNTNVVWKVGVIAPQRSRENDFLAFVLRTIGFVVTMLKIGTATIIGTVEVKREFQNVRARAVQ